jgi:hypothetical protein
MKRLNLVSAVVLIMVLGFTGLSQEQNNTRETADELLGKFIRFGARQSLFQEPFLWLKIKGVFGFSWFKIKGVLRFHGSKSRMFSLLYGSKSKKERRQTKKISVTSVFSVAKKIAAKSIPDQWKYPDSLEARILK